MSEVSDHEQKDEKVTLIEKPKRTKTAKQVEQFQKVILRKKEMDEKRKLAKQIEASKLLLQHDPEFLKQNSEVVKENKSEKSKKSKKIIEKEYESSSSSSSSSESSISEEIPIKHKKEKKKKNKKEVIQVKKSKPRKAKLIIYSESEEDSTDSEQKSDSDHNKPVHKRNFKTQQNKKSVLNIQNKDVKINIKPLYDPKNYFV